MRMMVMMIFLLLFLRTIFCNFPQFFCFLKFWLRAVGSLDLLLGEICDDDDDGFFSSLVFSLYLGFFVKFFSLDSGS